MNKHSNVKSRRKLINPIFHLQTKDEEDKYLKKDIIKNVRRTGQLNLSCLHLANVPEKMFRIYELTDVKSMNVDFSRSSTDNDEVWWNMKPLTNLDLSSNILTMLPGQIGMFQDLEVLNLQDNNLTSLPTEINGLTKLMKLNISHNKITEIPEDISKLIELRILLASYNCLENVPNSMSDLVMLEKLDLSENSITKLPSGIGFLVRLTELSISNNKLQDLPPDIVNLRSLLKLDISHNSIKYLPAMGELRKLQILYARHNDIEEIPDFAGCENIQELYFGNNFFKSIPEGFFENMVHLKILEFRDNQITTIPTEITSVAHLSKLDLTNNELTELPSVMGLLPHMQSLKLEGNKFKQIRGDVIRTGTQRILKFLRERITEEDMETVENLFPHCQTNDACIFPDSNCYRYAMKNGNVLNLSMKELSNVPDEVFQEAKKANVMIVDMCKNKFTEIPTGLEVISQCLTELILSVNQIRKVPDFLKVCTKLKYLDLGSNMLNTLPDSLISLESLRELVLSTNRFTVIPQCVYNMASLEILLLNDNNIGEINVDGLKQLTRLTTLNLSNNNIIHVPPELGTMTQLRTLELRGNSFRQPRYAVLEKGTDSILSYLRDKIST